MLRLKDLEKDIYIERIQIEIDSGKVTDHEGRAIIDMNRAGVGLLEVVTPPVFRSSQESVLFVKTLQAILKDAQVCEGGLEAGQFRIDANVSVTGPRAPIEAPPLGVRVEIKNLNSFTALVDAIEFESKRQADLLQSGTLPRKETRGFKSTSKETFSLRSKEETSDYRFIRDYDIPRIKVSETMLYNIRQQLPKTRQQRVHDLCQMFGLSERQAGQFLTNPRLRDLFEAIMEINPTLDGQFVFNWIMVDLLGQMHKLNLDMNLTRFSAQKAVDLLLLITMGRLSRNPSKQVLCECLLDEDSQPIQIAERLGLLIDNVSNYDLIDACYALFDKDPAKAREAAQGQRSLDYFMGPLMRHFKGRVQPQRLRQILADALDKLN
jgi:aspartyl-tRNA(Asn)/glutamyl-tRNA(Gln) amidotransferase subunit B